MLSRPSSAELHQRQRRATPSSFGTLLRRWRGARRMSQIDLAHAVSCSPKHLSFLETGRANPSPEMATRFAVALELPMRARNELLIAAGFAPLYPETPLGGTLLTGVRTALEFMLRQQEPYPAMVVDPGWNIVMINRAMVLMGRAFMAPGAARAASEAAGNANLVIFDPRLMRSSVENWNEVARLIIERVAQEARRAVPRSPIARHLSRLLAFPGAPRPDTRPDTVPVEPLMTVALRRGDTALRYFSTLATFGTPHDITLQELRIKSFFPADDESAATFRRLAAEDTRMRSEGGLPLMPIWSRGVD
jgi:transcriptional regulator with XRE-family HTH domain